MKAEEKLNEPKIEDSIDEASKNTSDSESKKSEEA